MKLGEALALRAELQKRMHQVQTRLLENASVQEGDTPALQPRELLAEYRAIVGEHERIVRRINRTNLVVRMRIDQEEATRAAAIVRRERLAREAGVLRELASHAVPSRNRFLRTEVRHVPTIDVAAVLAEADGLSQAHPCPGRAHPAGELGYGTDRMKTAVRRSVRTRARANATMGHRSIATGIANLMRAGQRTSPCTPIRRTGNRAPGRRQTAYSHRTDTNVRSGERPP